MEIVSVQSRFLTGIQVTSMIPNVLGLNKSG